MNIQRKWAIRSMVVVIPLLLCVVVSLFLCRVNSEFSPFRVYDLGVCQDISPNGEPIGIANTFSVDVERIYAFFTLDSKIPIRLKMRWYLENQLIYEYESLYHPGVNFGWIATHEPSGFEEGEYQVKVANQVASFRIEKVASTARLYLKDILME